MGKQQKQCQTLSSWAPKSLQRVTAALKWKDTGQHIKNQRCYFANKNPCSQSYGFSSNHVWMWELDHEEGCALKNWCFWTVVLEKTLESPLDSKEVQPVHPKGDQSECSLDELMLKLKLQYFGHLMWRTDSFEKTLMLWKIECRRRGLQRMRWLDGFTDSWTWAWVMGDGEGQGSLACCSPRGCKKSDITERLNERQQWLITG